jgi:GTPase-activating protein BEM2
MQILRGRVDSETTDTNFVHGVNRKPDDRRVLASPGSGVSNLNQGGTVIPVYNGDLLLVVQSGSGSGSESLPPSRPPSSMSPSRPTSSVADSITDKGLGRAPSIRVKPGSSQGLDRKTSVARRSSLPSISHGRANYILSERSSEPPLRVIVQAGTLNNLVNILVFGLQNVSVSVADDNGEMSLSQGMTRELYVDRPEFAKIWWNTYRSFVSPLVFFEASTWHALGRNHANGEYFSS